MNDPWHRWNVSLKPLLWGVILSLLLTLASYFIFVGKILSGDELVLTIAIFATVQVLLQLVLFLQVGVESKPRWNLMITLFMFLMVFILVGGSMWIMHNLEYNLMTGMEH